MIRIRNILYDEESQEADVELESNGICVTCYSHPVKNIEHLYQSHNVKLLAYQVTNTQIEDISTPTAIKTTQGYYSYYLRGKIISDSQIQIYDFVINIGSLPGDACIGKYISCQCLRLDLFEYNCR